MHRQKYTYLGEGRNPFSGWWDVKVRRDDGVELRISKKRYQELKEIGRIEGSK